MPTEAIPLALLLLGVITTAVTAPPGQKPVLTTVHNTSNVVAKDATLVTPSTTKDRLIRFQQSCQGKELGKDCLAYNQLLSDMAQRMFGSNDTDLIFNQELSRTVTPQEDLCSNLTELMRHLPARLMHDVLKPFTQVKRCVSLCYQTQGEEEDTLKDSCRVLYVGYRALVQSLANPPNQAAPPNSVPEQQEPVEAIDGNQQTKLSKDQMKPLNVTVIGNKEATDKIIPNISNNPPNDAKIPAQIPDAPPNEGEPVAKEANKQEKIALQKPQEQPAIPPQDTMEKGANDGDAEPDGEEDVNNFDDEQKEPDNPTQNDVNDQLDSNESPGRSGEGVNEILNPPEDTKLGGNMMGKDTVAQEKGHSHGGEAPEQVEMSQTSDIMQGTDPFYNQNDSNFFPYFLFAMFSCAMLYVAYHNKSKLMALVVEGRRTSSGRGGFSKGRKHTAAYRKLDSNLEEAITSGSATGGHASSQIIY